MNRIAKMEDEKRIEMVEYYQCMLNNLNLEEYKKSREIAATLNISSREWRKHVENIMHLFMYDYLDKMVIGTKNGYLLTNDKDMIDKFLEVKEHQFKALAYNCYNLEKAVNKKDNYTIDDFMHDTLCD